MVIKNLLVKIGADVSEYERAFKNAQSNIKHLGEGLQKVGMGLTAAVTLPLIGIGAAAAKMSIEFNAAMANVATLIPGNTKRIAELKSGVQDLASETGKRTSDMAKGLYQVISALGDTSDSMKILEISAKAGAAGLATTLESVDLITAVIKGYGDVSAESAQKAADLAFQTVKLGQTTFPELAASIGAVVPMAAALNVSQEELFNGFATLTGVTGSASEVSTQLKGALSNLMKPSEDMAAAIAKLGYSGSEAIIQSLGMVGAFRAVIGTTDGSTESIGKLFNNIRGLPAVLALTGGQAATFDEKMKAMAASSGIMMEAFVEQTEGINKLGHTFEKFRTKLEVIAQKLGDALAPALTTMTDLMQPIIDLIGKVVSAFGKMPSGIKIVVVAIAGFAAALGPVLLIIGKLILLAPAMGAAWTMLTGPIGLVALAIAGLVTAGILVYKNWEKIKGWFVTLWTYLKTFFVAVWKTIAGVLGPVVQGIIDLFTGLYSAVKTIALAIGNAVVGAFRWLRDSAVSIFQAVAEFVVDKLLWLMDQIAKIPIVKKFVKNLQEGLAAAKASIAEAREKMKDDTSGMADDAKTAGGKIGASYEGIGESAGQMKAVLSSVHAELVDVIKKGTLSELEYARWAAEEAYAARKKAIEEEITDVRARNQELKLLAQARGIELAAIEKSFAETRAQEERAFMEEVKAAESEWWTERLAAAKSFSDQKAKLIDGIKQMTLSEVEYKRWALEQERLAEETRVMSSKELSTQQKEELLALLADYYAKKRAQAEADASAEVALAEETQTAITGVLNSGIENILSAFEEFGSGAKTVFGAFGSALKATVGTAISALKDLVKAVLKTAIENIAASQSEAIASVIASVMKLPFPLNLLTVGGAIAAVSALFSAIKLGEGGLVTGPTLALVGEAGPEMVIPLNKFNFLSGGPAGGGEGPSITLNVNSPLIQTTGLSKGQVDELAPYLFNAVESEARRYGFSLKKR